MAETFDFDVEFQRRLLRMCMTDEPFCHKVMQYVTQGYFTTKPLGWIFAAFARYHEAYGIRCTDMPMRESVRLEPTYAAEVESVIALGEVTEEAYIKSKLEDFVRRNIFAHAHVESQKLYNVGNHDKAYDQMCTAMDDLRLVTFEAPDRSWLFDELEQRTKRRYWNSLTPTEGVYPTGMVPVDDLMGGGPRLGELHLILGIAKAGKTTFLINRGAVTCRILREPVVHFNLEGTTNLVEDRYDSWFSQELYFNVRKGDINPALFKEMQAEYAQLRKLMVIRTLNEWDVNILHIDAELKELKAMGHNAKFIIVDYADLMRSRNQAGSETEHQTNAMKDLKRLANRGLCIWSGCQGQRPKEGSDEKEWILKSHKIADAYAKIRIADGYGSVNNTREERERQVSRYFFEDWRDGPVGKLFLLKNASDRMMHGVEVTPMKMTEAAGAPA